MEWLSKILEGIENADELAMKIKGELPKSFIPKDKYNEMVNQKRMFEQKKMEIDVEKVRDAALVTVITATSGQHKMKDAEVVKMLIDKNAIGVDEEGNLTGFDEQIKLLQKQKPYLFGGDPLEGKTPFAGETMPAVTKEQFSKMGYRERIKLFEEKPELYKNLKDN